MPDAVIPSPMDVAFLSTIRRGVQELQERVVRDVVEPGMRVLDIAPEIHAGVQPMLPAGVELDTLDIDPAAGATFTADLCSRNEHVPGNLYAVVFCTEVLEHTRQPFAAARELFRLLRPGGTLAVTTPFNFRIHGPLPDCWRFTEHGLRELFTDFDDVQIRAIEAPGRPLMPVQYATTARRPG